MAEEKRKFFAKYKASAKKTKTVLIILAIQIIMVVMLMYPYGWEATVSAILPELMELLLILEKKQDE